MGPSRNRGGSTASALATRIVAGLLAVCWLGAGAAAIGFGVARGTWVAAVFGVLALAYGVAWVRVTYLGRRLEWPNRSRRR
jgi:hypothetical protein